MDDQLILKNRLKVARAEKGLSQTQLAEMVGATVAVAVAVAESQK